MNVHTDVDRFMRVERVCVCVCVFWWMHMAGGGSSGRGEGTPHPSLNPYFSPVLTSPNQ